MARRNLAPLLGAAILGILMIVYGGYDDSPGLQLLGLVLIVVGVLIHWKRRR